MALLPKVKLKAMLSFPSAILDGAGIDVSRVNGAFKFDIAFDDFAPPVVSISDPTHQNALLWNSATDTYVLAPVSLVAAGGGVAEAPNDGVQYGRQSLNWTPVVGGGSTVLPSNSNPVIDGAVAPGVSTAYSRGDHVHPSNTANPSATIGLTSVNGTATTAIRSDAAPALSQTIAPTWTGKHIFTTTAGGVELSGAPNISKSFSGDTPNFAFYQTATAASASVPEYGAHFGMVSAVGSANPLSAHKVGLATDATAQTGSASVWAQVSVANLLAGASSTLNGIGHEIDLNVLNAAYSSNAGPYAANLLLTGTTASSATYATAGIVIAYGGSVNPLWNYGILGADYPSSQAFKTAFISDQSISPTTLHSNTAHTTGIDFRNASFSDVAIITPGFVVDRAGDILGASINVAGRITGTDNTNTAGRVLFQLQGGTSTIIDSTTIYCNFVNPSNTVQRGGIYAADSGGVAHVSYATASDRYLKEDLGEFDDALTRLMAVNVRKYKGVGYEGDDFGVGYFAQELHEVYPWAVTPSIYDKAGTPEERRAHPWTVDYGRVTPLIIAGFQQAMKAKDEKIADLEKRLTELERRMSPQ